MNTSEATKVSSTSVKWSDRYLTDNLVKTVFDYFRNVAICGAMLGIGLYLQKGQGVPNFLSINQQFIDVLAYIIMVYALLLFVFNLLHAITKVTQSDDSELTQFPKALIIYLPSVIMFVAVAIKGIT
jgi:hypothetical protein